MTEAKSGLKQLKAGEVLFNDGESAESLFIIQKGQLRLYKPKGKGFIEIAVLRTGEVLGEMAYFDEEGSGNKRSCSASAMVATEVIEISFPAFAKTMATLNPWFKTIINTLASRLRKANGRIKELENNQVASYGKAGTYEFMKPMDVMKVLGTLYLVYKTHGEKKENGILVNKKTIDLYSYEMFNIPEVKMDAVILTLKDLDWLAISDDAEKMPYNFTIKNLDQLRSLFIFYNTEKHLPEDKKMKIGQNCQTFLERILMTGATNPPRPIANLRRDDRGNPIGKYTTHFLLNGLLEEFKNKNLPIKPDHLDDARTVGICGEFFVQDGEALIEIDFPKLQKLYPVIRFVNLMNNANKEKNQNLG
jgi:CRP/FNR family cyclic AMP-dependent transcriptional regulator